MFVRIVLIVACLSLSTGLYAQEDLPDDFLGFFKAGQYVGVHFKDKAGASVVIYDSKDMWDMMVDSQKLSFSDLRKKYPEAEKQAIEYIELEKKWTEKRGLRESDPNPTLSIYGPGEQFGRVLRVGKNYVLVEFENRHRTVITAHTIEYISWGDGRFQIYRQPSMPNPQPAPAVSAKP